MFLGLTNSADDIIRDRAVLQRERNLNVRLPYYVFAKTISLGVFALVQCVLFVLIGNYILEIRGMFWLYLGDRLHDRDERRRRSAWSFPRSWPIRKPRPTSSRWF